MGGRTAAFGANRLSDVSLHGAANTVFGGAYGQVEAQWNHVGCRVSKGSEHLLKTSPSETLATTAVRRLVQRGDRGHFVSVPPWASFSCIGSPHRRRTGESRKRSGVHRLSRFGRSY